MTLTGASSEAHCHWLRDQRGYSAQFKIDICDDVAGFYTGWFDALWEESGRSCDNRAIIRAVYDRWERPDGAPEIKPARRVAARKKIADVAFSAEELKGLI